MCHTKTENGSLSMKSAVHFLRGGSALLAKRTKDPNPRARKIMNRCLETAKRAISDLDSEIKKLTGLRDTWVKCCGKIEGELYGRILP